MKNIDNILIFNKFDKIQFSLRFVENSFAVLVRPPPNLPSGGGLVASLRRCGRMGTTAGWRLAAG